MLKVNLISYTPEPEKTIACAAKLCYSAASIDKIADGLTSEKTSSFINMLMDLGHESPIEHVSFTFGIEGVSRALLAQLTRHRIASYSVQSQRYVSEDNFEYVVPPEIAAIKEAREEFLAAMEEDQKHYLSITEKLFKHHLKEMIKDGQDEKTASNMAKKKAIEDARFVLPNACTTKIICTFNARSLMNFFEHRCCSRAQWEIRELAIEMFKLVFKVAPNLFKNAGAPCVSKKCPEGKMSCGKIVEVKNFFEDIKNI